MSFDARLSFTDSSGKAQTSIKVLECDFGFTQNLDHLTGKPNARVLINNINLVVESSRDTQLADWMVNNLADKNGKIEIAIHNNVKKTIEFEDAFCVQYHESFNYLGEDTPMHISISFATRKISLDDNIYYQLDET